MDTLKTLLALHAPGVRPTLADELAEHGLDVVVTANQAETWAATRDREPDVVVLAPLATDADAVELRSLLQRAGEPGGPALVLLTDRPGSLASMAARVDDFIAADDATEGIVERLRFAVVRRRALQAEREDLRHQTITDFKTGLWNDRHFHDQYRIECARASREDRPVGLALIDLDDFKAVNDQHDHVFGDHVLATLADTLRKGLRPFDTAARLGGDEFAVLLPNTPLEHAERIAERLRATVAALEVTNGEHTTNITITVGVAVWDPSGPESADEALKGADQALLAAKRDGRNRVGVHGERPRRGKRRAGRAAKKRA